MLLFASKNPSPSIGLILMLIAKHHIANRASTSVKIPTGHINVGHPFCSCLVQTPAIDSSWYSQWRNGGARMHPISSSSWYWWNKSCTMWDGMEFYFRIMTVASNCLYARVYLPQMCNMKTEAMKSRLITSTGTGPTLIPGESSV